MRAHKVKKHHVCVKASCSNVCLCRSLFVSGLLLPVIIVEVGVGTSERDALIWAFHNRLEGKR
jgi:hypothetical protein